MIAVYSSHVGIVRKQIWPILDNLAKLVNGPQIIGGDFYTTMNATEREGGAGNTTNACNLFREWFHRNQMCDLGFQGPLLLGLEGRFINS